MDEVQAALGVEGLFGLVEVGEGVEAVDIVGLLDFRGCHGVRVESGMLG